MEACGGSHYWGRTLQAMGHRVRLIPAQYVKPFVKRSKNDRNDAQAISEAAARPGMQEVAVKSADAQARAMLLTVRELLVRQRTQLVNALRGHATEMGWWRRSVTKGLPALRSEIEADATLPEAAAEALRLLGRRPIDWKQGWRKSTRICWRNTRPIPTAAVCQPFPGLGDERT